MFLYGRGVGGSERGEFVADACIGDDEAESIDSLSFDVAHRIGGVGCGFAVDLHHQEFAGGVFGKGGELL